MARQAGLEPTPMPDAPAPADAEGARLAQMKELARRFSASADGGPGGRLQLRLMASPLLRYHDEATALLDGACLRIRLRHEPRRPARL